MLKRIYKNPKKRNLRISLGLKKAYQNGKRKSWNKGMTGIGGWKWNKEARKKMSEIVKKSGRKPPSRKGTKNTKEQKEKIRKTWKKIIELNNEKNPNLKPMYGSDNPSWQGGKSYEMYGFDWTDLLKHSIRTRDCFVCQICKKNGWVVHHIDYNKKNNNPNNLITLCNSCHSKTNGNRNYWIKYFNENK